MEIFSKYPLNKTRTQSLMHSNGYGAVIAADCKKIYGFDGEKYGTVPNFDETNRQLDSADGLPQHLHPIINRYQPAGGADLPLLKGRVAQLGLPVVEQFAGRVKRMTLAHELCLCHENLWPELVDFYSLVNARYPDLELWIGDCNIRSPLDRDGILTRLEDLRGIITGFICVDHVDLSSNKNGAYQFMKVSAAGLVSLRRFKYLAGFWKSLEAMGIRYALETSAISEKDTPMVRSAQGAMFRDLGGLCEKHSAEFWWWDMCDDATRDVKDDSRVVYGGIYGVDGAARW